MELRRVRNVLATMTVLITPLLAPSQPAFASVSAIVNELRIQGCGGIRAPDAPLQLVGALHEAARQLSRGGSLEKALERAGYAATHSISIHVKGGTDDSSLERLLRGSHCSNIANPLFKEVGEFRRGDEIWLVLAQPHPRDPVLDPTAVPSRVLALVNAARSKPRNCGHEHFDAAPPLTLSPVLSGAAALHAQDMAAHRQITHRGSDGSMSGDRITRAGYEWRASGENVAAGQKDEEAVVAAWVESPGHCATLMNPVFTEMGIAYALAPSANPGIYWAQLFATPR